MGKKRSEAELVRIATDILEQHKVARPPVPIERIARALGAQIRFLPYDGDLSGMFFRDKEQKIIGVNSLHHPNRQRFTIAHECSHMLLHAEQEMFIDRGSVVFNRDPKSSEGTDQHEIEANTLAAELLMPRKFLLPELRTADIEDDVALTALAKKYQVSVQALMWRMSNLSRIT